jgi:hypothetical protein
MLKVFSQARRQWLTPVILATQEARDQEYHSLKPARANSSQDPFWKNPSQKRAGGVAQGVDPEFKPQYQKKKKGGEESHIDE